MVTSYRRASTGNPALDGIIDGMRLGDCVMWRLDDLSDYRKLTQDFVSHALDEGRAVHHVRFADNDVLGGEPLIRDPRIVVDHVDPRGGFESFTSAVDSLIAHNGPHAFHVFDPLTALLRIWYSDVAVANLFKVVCPALFDQDGIGWFGVLRGAHTLATSATLSDTTQLLIDVQRLDDRVVVRPLKVWLRGTSQIPGAWELDGTGAHRLTDRRTLRRLDATAETEVLDPWHTAIRRGNTALASLDEGECDAAKAEIIGMAIAHDPRVVELARRHFALDDLMGIVDRIVGTGWIGGKSTGMLMARAILSHHPSGRFAGRMESHDSFFLGSDLFNTFIIANGWWKLWADQKSPDGYFTAGARLNKRLTTGTFPPAIREQLRTLLGHFGTDPIIVRSSSLLEDNFGNAFAGKYESVFCTNQGSLDDRLFALEDAIRTVYASLMGSEALEYRRHRGLDAADEQMAILVQRVSGARHGDYFFPHAAGVGNSTNAYVWDPEMDPQAGMLRLVLGLGTRAVDRTITDHAKIVTLDDPLRRVGTGADNRTQRYVDVLCIPQNRAQTLPLTEVCDLDLGTDWKHFLSVDTETLRWLRENNRPYTRTPMVLDFAKLLSQTDLGDLFRAIMEALTSAYDHPVDIEYTINMVGDVPMFNLVQCRPLQFRGLGQAVEMPVDPDPDKVLVSTHGSFMGGNLRAPISHVILVRPEAYLALGQQERYAVARGIGVLNKALAGESFMVMGPGRWGTTTPSLGIPVHFTELSNATVIAEFTHAAGGFLPELSQGSHFFQDLVESGIFYAGIFDRDPQVSFHPELVTQAPNRLTGIAPELFRLCEVVHVASFDDLVLYADIAIQRLVCCRQG